MMNVKFIIYFRTFSLLSVVDCDGSGSGDCSGSGDGSDSGDWSGSGDGSGSGSTPSFIGGGYDTDACSCASGFTGTLCGEICKLC